MADNQTFIALAVNSTQIQLLSTSGFFFFLFSFPTKFGFQNVVQIGLSWTLMIMTIPQEGREINWKKSKSLRICEADPSGKTSTLLYGYKSTSHHLPCCFLNLVNVLLPQSYCIYPSLCLDLLPSIYPNYLALQSDVLTQMFLLLVVPWSPHLNHKFTLNISSPPPAVFSFQNLLSNIPYVFLFLLCTVRLSY